MVQERKLPDDALEFIKKRLRERRVFWTYHVNMRLVGRYINRSEILAAIDSYEIVESYPQDKYLPSYLLHGSAFGSDFHVLIAVDVDEENVRIVTAYRPDLKHWEPDMKTRRRIQ
jgi:hypothetical protein